MPFLKGVFKPLSADIASQCPKCGDDIKCNVGACERSVLRLYCEICLANKLNRVLNSALQEGRAAGRAEGRADKSVEKNCPVCGALIDASKWCPNCFEKAVNERVQAALAEHNLWIVPNEGVSS